jgi:DNA-binding transcriptional regulator YiaG
MKAQPQMTPNQILEQIISSVEEGLPAGDKDNPAVMKRRTEIGLLIKQFRESLALTPKEFAQQLDVSAQTIHRWENGNPIPRTPQARKFQQLLEPDSRVAATPPEEQKELVEIGEHHVAVRSWRYIMERIKEARCVWVLKCNREFLAGWAGPSRRNIIESMENNDRLDFYYFFSENLSVESGMLESGESANPALDSFKRFKKRLNSQHPQLTHRVHGYAISDPIDRVLLGLTPTYPTWIMLEYESDAQARHGKEFDILVEVPVAVYEPPEMMLSDDEYVVWLELPQRRADFLWDRWKQLFKQRTGDKKWVEYEVGA